MKKIGEVKILHRKNGDVERVENKNVWGKVFGGDVEDVDLWGIVYFIIPKYLYDKVRRILDGKYNNEDREYKMKFKNRTKYGKTTTKCYIARPHEDEAIKEILEEMDGFTGVCEEPHKKEDEENKWELSIDVDEDGFDRVFQHDVAKAI